MEWVFLGSSSGRGDSLEDCKRAAEVQERPVNQLPVEEMI
jgi:hypothetical protein